MPRKVIRALLSICAFSVSTLAELPLAAGDIREISFLIIVH
jgi:hypothetical protein